MVLTKFELELMEGALREKVHALEAYVRWVDDRPLLPNVDAAIGRINEEIKAVIGLQLKVMEERQK